MDIVLFFQSTIRKSWLLKLSGAYRFAREHGWFLQIVDGHSSAREIRQALERWHPIGCLVDRGLAHGSAPDRVFEGFPTVYLDQRATSIPCRHPRLVHDSAAEARLAGQALLDLDCASYAYLGTGRNYFWDHERCETFRALCAGQGRTMTTLSRLRLAQTIAALPKPCGILAANDGCAVEIWPAAATCGLSIPNDIAVAGIDNDETYAEAVTPGLTSAEPDFEGAGYELARLLMDEIARVRNGGRRDGPAPVSHYGALRLVRRGSTQILAGNDPRVGHALEFIRRHACEHGLSTSDVIAIMGCSRRLATERFKKAVGHSILDEIHARRFDEVLRLLRNPHQQIEPIADLCGYSAPSFLKRIFKKKTGLTMRAWRKRAADRGPAA